MSGNLNRHFNFSNFKIFLMPWKSDFVRKIDFVISDIFKKIPVELMLFDLCYAKIFLARRYTHLLNLFYNYGKQ